MSRTPPRSPRQPTSALVPFYRLAVSALRPIASAVAATARTPDRRDEWDERLARRLPPATPGIWIHGASVGEARLVRALANELRRRRSDLPLAVSAMTRTGRAVLPSGPEVDAAFFLPLDFEPLPGRILDSLKPRGLVLVETELWPNLLRAARNRRIPVGVVNARLSPERMARYRRFRGFFSSLLAALDRIAAASDEEAARFVEIGAPPPVVTVVGNMKYDVPTPAVGRSFLRRRFGVAPDRPVVVSGSTGAGEDPPVLDAYAAVRRDHPALFLVLAPRHPERFASARDEATARGLRVHVLSSGSDASAGAADVLIVDTVGELATLYALGDVAFVGGSLVPVGGHNLLEPLAAGVPVTYGPHLHHVTEIANLLDREGAGIRVPDAAGLAASWSRLLDDSVFRRAAVEAGFAVISRHRGAVSRSADVVLEMIDRASRPGR